jgi:hypothetical protein
MNQTIYAFHKTGKKAFSLHLPEPITNMSLLFHQPTNSKAIMIALRDGDIRIYNESGKDLLSVIHNPGKISAMLFGQYSFYFFFY